MMKTWYSENSSYELPPEDFDKLIESGALNEANAAGEGVLNKNHSFTADEVLLLLQDGK